MLERGDGDLRIHAIRAYHLCCPLRERRRAPLELCVEVYPPLIAFEHLLEGRDAFAREWLPKPRASIQGPQRCQRLTRDWPGTIGRPVKRIVVDDDKVAVTGTGDIQLEMAHSHLERQIKSRQGVFRGV